MISPSFISTTHVAVDGARDGDEDLILPKGGEAEVEVIRTSREAFSPDIVRSSILFLLGVHHFLFLPPPSSFKLFELAF